MGDERKIVAQFHKSPVTRRKPLTRRLVQELIAMVARAEQQRWDLDGSGPAQDLAAAKALLREVTRPQPTTPEQRP